MTDHATFHSFLQTWRGDVVLHLWTSTLLLLLSMAAALFARRSSRIRHSILLTGVASFAIPARAVLRLLARAGLDLLAFLPHRPLTTSLPFRILGASPAATPASTTESEVFCVLALIWATAAATIVMMHLLHRRRVTREIARTTTTASPREEKALARAIVFIGTHRRLRVIRSAAAHAPAAAGVFSGTLVLPAEGCADLDDAQLQSIMLHEIAHILRRDNLVSLAVSIVRAAFWFHPLLWLSARALNMAREEACDETVADVTRRPDTYIKALTVICSSSLTAPVAGVSCMASSQLKERMEHLMRYTPSKHRRALVPVLSIISLLALTVVIGVVQAAPAGIDATRPSSHNYRLSVAVTPHKGAAGESFMVNARVTSRTDGTLLFAPSIQVLPGVPASASSDDGVHKFTFTTNVDANGHGDGHLTVTNRSGVVDFVGNVVFTGSHAGTEDPEVMSLARLSTIDNPSSDPFAIHLSASTSQTGIYLKGTASRRSDGKVFPLPTMSFASSGKHAVASGRSGNTEDDIEFVIHASLDDGRSGQATYEVRIAGRVVQSTLIPFTVGAAHYTGEPVSLNLKDADVHDVFRVLSQLTGYEVAVDPDVAGKITIKATNMPWDEFVDTVANQNGLQAIISGKSIRVSRVK